MSNNDFIFSQEEVNAYKVYCKCQNKPHRMLFNIYFSYKTNFTTRNFIQKKSNFIHL